MKFVLSTICLLLLSCEDSSYIPTKVDAPNTSPEIISIVAEPNNLLPGDTAKVYCTFSDFDNDDLEIIWTSTSGFVEYYQTRDSVYYQPFNFFGNQYVALELRDAESIFRDTVLITHREYGDFSEMINIPAGDVYLTDYIGSERIDTKYHLDHNYLIGRYEVTVSQYVDFLNSAYSKALVWLDTTVVKGDFPGDGINENGDYAFIEISLTPPIGPWQPDIWFVDDVFYANPDRPYFPVGSVSWFGANAYAAYYGMRLPTETEWMRAARGGDTRNYPWGKYNQDCSVSNSMYTCFQSKIQVGVSTERSPFGLCDTNGNISEWVSSISDTDHSGLLCGDSYVNRISLGLGTCGVWYEELMLPSYGFRVAMDQ